MTLTEVLPGASVVRDPACQPDGDLYIKQPRGCPPGSRLELAKMDALKQSSLAQVHPERQSFAIRNIESALVRYCHCICPCWLSER